MSVDGRNFCEEEGFLTIVLGVVCSVRSRGVVSIFPYKVDLQTGRCCPSVHLVLQKERRIIS